MFEDHTTAFCTRCVTRGRCALQRRLACMVIHAIGVGGTVGFLLSVILRLANALSPCIYESQDGGQHWKCSDVWIQQGSEAATHSVAISLGLVIDAFAAGTASFFCLVFQLLLHAFHSWQRVSHPTQPVESVNPFMQPSVATYQYQVLGEAQGYQVFGEEHVDVARDFRELDGSSTKGDGRCERVRGDVHKSSHCIPPTPNEDEPHLVLCVNPPADPDPFVPTLTVLATVSGLVTRATLSVIACCLWRDVLFKLTTGLLSVLLSILVVSPILGTL